MAIPALPEGTIKRYEDAQKKHEAKGERHFMVKDDQVINTFGWNLTWVCVCGETIREAGRH
jgi:hypothetical protein